MIFFFARSCRFHVFILLSLQLYLFSYSCKLNIFSLCILSIVLEYIIVKHKVIDIGGALREKMLDIESQ